MLLSCRELVEFLDEYWSGRLPPETVAAFEEHLAACPSCINYTNTYRDTIRLAGQAFGPEEPAPADVPESLVSAILALRARPDGRS
jgi:anti-sigma factor RsiW